MSYKLATIAHQLALSLVIVGFFDRKHQQVVEIKGRTTDVPKPHTVPNDYAGDSWRRQGKRKGQRR